MATTAAALLAALGANYSARLINPDDVAQDMVRAGATIKVEERKYSIIWNGEGGSSHEARIHMHVFEPGVAGKEDAVWLNDPPTKFQDDTAKKLPQTLAELIAVAGAAETPIDVFLAHDPVPANATYTIFDAKAPSYEGGRTALATVWALDTNGVAFKLLRLAYVDQGNLKLIPYVTTK